MSAQEKILIRTPNWLGDLIMATGFIQAVLEQYPEAQVDLIVKKGLEALPLPHRGTILPFDKSSTSSAAFGKKLRASEYQRFFILPPSFSSAWMGFCSKIPERIAYAGEGRSYLLSTAKKRVAKARSIHLLKEYLGLLDQESKLEQYPPHLSVSPEWIQEHLKNIAESPDNFIVLAPGAIYGPAKQWPVEHFKTLALKLHERFQLPIIVLGTPKEYELGEIIHSGHPEILNWCGKTSLVELLALLTQASLLVSNDSGSMHLMSALQGKQIAVFGSTSPTWTSPVNVNARIIQHEHSCSPCFQRECKFAHYACLQEIRPDEVLEIAEDLLGS